MLLSSQKRRDRSLQNATTSQGIEHNSTVRAHKPTTSISKTEYNNNNSTTSSSIQNKLIKKKSYSFNKLLEARE